MRPSFFGLQEVRCCWSKSNTNALSAFECCIENNRGAASSIKYASSLRRLTKRIGTNLGNDQELILPLIIVADMVKRCTLCTILGEIGVVVSSDC